MDFDDLDEDQGLHFSFRVQQLCVGDKYFLLLMIVLLIMIIRNIIRSLSLSMYIYIYIHIYIYIDVLDWRQR